MTYQQEIIFIWRRYTSKYRTILWIFGYHAIHVQFGDRFFAATVEKMVILAKSLHYTATVVNGGKKS